MLVHGFEHHCSSVAPNLQVWSRMQCKHASELTLREGHKGYQLSVKCAWHCPAAQRSASSNPARQHVQPQPCVDQPSEHHRRVLAPFLQCGLRRQAEQAAASMRPLPQLVGKLSMHCSLHLVAGTPGPMAAFCTVCRASSSSPPFAGVFQSAANTP